MPAGGGYKVDGVEQYPKQRIKGAISLTKIEVCVYIHIIQHINIYTYIHTLYILYIQHYTLYTLYIEHFTYIIHIYIHSIYII